MLTPSEIPPPVIAPPFALSILPRRGWRAGGPRGTRRSPPATPAAHPRAPARCSRSRAPGRGASARPARRRGPQTRRSEEHTSELQSRSDLVCRLLLEKKKKTLDRQTLL